MAKKQAASKKAPEDHQPLIVTCSGDRPVHEVVKDLKDAGFQVSQVLDAIGSVTGSAPAKSKNTLKKIRGVADVSEDHPVDIGPPDSTIS